MKVREINRNILGQAVVLIEADDYPVYNGMIGTVEEDEKRGFIFNPALRKLRSQDKTYHSIPLKPSDMIEPLE